MQLWLVCLLCFVTCFTGASAAKLSLEGSLITLYVDHSLHIEQEHKHNEDLRYYLRTKQGKTYRLKFKQAPSEAEKISQINIQGNLIANDEVEVLSYQEKPSSKKFSLVNADKSSARSNQKTLLVPIQNPHSNSGFLYQGQQLSDLVFSNSGLSLQTYFKEVSGSRISFSGQVAPVLQLSGSFCAERQLFSGKAWLSVLELIYKNYDLSKFDRLSVIVPDDPYCLGSSALGVGSLGKAEFEDNNGKRFSISFNFVRSYTEPSTNDVSFISILAHEFGHNLGLRHDNGNSCGKEVFSKSCPSIEYAGAHSIMGIAPSLAHMNLIHKENLAWVDSQEIITINDSRHDAEYTLSAVSANNSLPKAIKIARADGSYYVIEYRQPINMESYQAFNDPISYNGFLVYLSNNKASNNSILLRSDLVDLRSQLGSLEHGVYNNYNQAKKFSVLAPFSSSFVDNVNKIQVTPLMMDSEKIIVKVTKGLVSIDNYEEDSSKPVSDSNYEPSQNDWEDAVIKAIANHQDSYYANKSLQLYIDLPRDLRENLTKLVKNIEWDYGDGHTIQVTNPGQIGSIHRFREAGTYNVSATINLLSGKNIRYELKNLLIREYFTLGINAVGKQASISSEPILNYNKATRLRLSISLPGLIHRNSSFRVLFPKTLTGSIKSLKKFKKIKLNGRRVNLPIHLLAEEKLKPVLLEYLDEDGYYIIPIAIQERERSLRIVKTYDVFLKLKSSM